MPKLKLQTLSMAATGRCNMSCPHCMRGPAMDQDMRGRVVWNVFQAISDVDTLCITGGEPSLVPYVIKRMLQAAKYYGTRVRSVHISTNGMYVPDAFLDVCLEWHIWCLDCEYGLADGFLPPMQATGFLRDYVTNDSAPGLTVALSQDPYHGAVPKHSLARLLSLPRLSLDKVHTHREGNGWVIPAGNAVTSSIKAVTESFRYLTDRDFARKICLKQDDGDDPESPVWIERLSIGPDGSVTVCGNHAWDVLPDMAIGDVMNPDWAEKLIQAHASRAEN